MWPPLAFAVRVGPASHQNPHTEVFPTRLMGGRGVNVEQPSSDDQSSALPFTIMCSPRSTILPTRCLQPMPGNTPPHRRAVFELNYIYLFFPVQAYSFLWVLQICK